MKYITSNDFQAQEAMTRLKYLISKGKIVDITAVNPNRTIKQNSYLHVLIAYFASQTGYTVDYVKREYYKKISNPDIYIRVMHDKILDRDVKYLRSSSDLSTDEMKTSIDRFKNWSANNGILLPDPTDSIGMATMEREIEKCKEWVLYSKPSE